MATNNDNTSSVGVTGYYYVGGFLTYQQQNYIQTGHVFVKKLGWDTIFVDPSNESLNNKSWNLTNNKKISADTNIESSLAFANAAQLNDLFLDTIDPSTWSSDKRRMLQTQRYEDSTGKHIKLVETNMKIKTTPTSNDKGSSCCITKNVTNGTDGYLFINGKCVIDQNLDKNDLTGPTFNDMNVSSGVFVNNKFQYGDSTNEITMNKNGELILNGTAKLTLNNNSINKISLSCFEGANQNALVTQNAVYMYGESKRSGTGLIPSGKMGPQGPQGFPYNPQGFQGPIPLGTQGPQGYQGYKGIDASEDLEGPQGAQGISPTGVQGIQGYMGNMGFQGITGQLQGPQGDTGSKGTNNTTRGQQGFDGMIGLVGSQGFQGDNGNAGIIYGSQGLTGLRGITGNTGLTGPDGGIRGTQGFIGFEGFRGTTGISGVSGIMGNTGLQGVTGLMGYPATGSTGLTGYMGEIGTQGFQGVVNIGFMGAQGIIGLRGLMGTTGVTGIMGIQGAQGIECSETGLHAPIGNANSVNFGSNDTVTFNFYRDAGLSDLTACTGSIRYMTCVNQSGDYTHSSISWRDMWTNQPVYGAVTGLLTNFLQVVSSNNYCYEPVLIKIGSGSDYITGKMLFTNDGVSNVIMDIQPNVAGGFTGNTLYIQGGSVSFTSTPAF